MISIVNYGTGNVGSIQNMIKKIGYKSIITSDIEEINKASKIIIPGVGKFDFGISQLQNLNLINVLNRKILTEKTPVLGICLGMQLLAKKSEEGSLPGLGWIDAETTKFNFSANSKLKIPNMGWQTIKKKKQSNLLHGLDNDSRFYFVHSYYVRCQNSDDVIITSEYEHEYTCGIEHDNILGVQFHPEKSHKFGMKLLQNFIELY